jgi:hypothetical protein
MAETPSAEPLTLREFPSAVWLTIGALLLAGAIIVQAIFPRYEFQMIGDDGRAMMIYDRWSGQFQRANYDERGEPSLTRVLTPF